MIKMFKKHSVNPHVLIFISSYIEQKGFLLSKLISLTLEKNAIYL